MYQGLVYAEERLESDRFYPGNFASSVSLISRALCLCGHLSSWLRVSAPQQHSTVRPARAETDCHEHLLVFKTLLVSVFSKFK